MSKGKILIVEPDDIIREWLEVELACDGYEVYSTIVPERALELFFDNDPDVMLLSSKFNSFDLKYLWLVLEFRSSLEIFMYEKKLVSRGIVDLEILPEGIEKTPLTNQERQKLSEWTARYRENCGE